ncbi:MvdC/MvdD family ATP grasp protein [Nonomuraea jabiensis]|uniref:MvdC/MvdD family ATP grasp protein n=1 Tax=Nonomuraea jabiensis TaxID=882448 RepID=UPI003D7332DD
MRPTQGTVLVITSVKDATANLVINALTERGATVARVDPADIGPGLTFSARIGAGRTRWTGRLSTSSREVALEDVQSVYYRRPSLWRFNELDTQAREFAMRGSKARPERIDRQSGPLPIREPSRTQ